MRNRGYLWERFEYRRVRGSEDIHIQILYKYYTNTIQILYKYIQIYHAYIHIQNTYIPLHTYKSIIPFLLCTFVNHTRTTCIFINAYILIARFPGCFSLFRLNLNKGYSYSMTYSFPISLHKFSYFLANLLIFNYLCIKLF